MVLLSPPATERLARSKNSPLRVRTPVVRGNKLSGRVMSLPG
jgi:hypothetical protein